MKNFKYIFSFLVLLFAFTACEEDALGPIVSTYAPPVILVPTAGSSYVLTEATQNNPIDVLEWEAADYGFPAAVTYTWEMDMVENNFAEPVEIVTSNLNRQRITVKELNDAAVNFVEAETTGEVSIRIKANLHSNVEVLYSEPVNITVTTYSSVKSVAPMYIVGNILGNKEWDNNNYEYVLFHEGDPAVFEYTYTGNMRENGFKILKQLGTWDLQFGLVDGELAEDDGGSSDIRVPSDGYFTFTINTKEVTYSLEPYDASGATTYATIGLIGEFNDWGADLYLTQTAYDPHIWILDDVELPEGEIKFRANGSWDYNWGAESFPFGKGTGGGPNIFVPAGTYFVKFNDLTGHYVFLAK